MRSITLLAISCFIFSCNNTTNEETKQPGEVTTHEEHHHEADTDSIILNKGEKWKVDEKMMTYIRSMESDVAGFSKAKPEDYKALAEKLKKNIDLLTSNCTMEGEAHDELHKWLLPFIELVDEFSKAANGNEAEEKFRHIKHSFETFNMYFQ